jgi:hypothetical protein
MSFGCAAASVAGVESAALALAVAKRGSSSEAASVAGVVEAGGSAVLAVAELELEAADELSVRLVAPAGGVLGGRMLGFSTSK